MRNEIARLHVFAKLYGFTLPDALIEALQDGTRLTFMMQLGLAELAHKQGEKRTAHEWHRLIRGLEENLGLGSAGHASEGVQ